MCKSLGSSTHHLAFCNFDKLIRRTGHYDISRIRETLTLTFWNCSRDCAGRCLQARLQRCDVAEDIGFLLSARLINECGALPHQGTKRRQIDTMQNDGTEGSHQTATQVHRRLDSSDATHLYARPVVLHRLILMIWVPLFARIDDSNRFTIAMRIQLSPVTWAMTTNSHRVVGSNWFKANGLLKD